MSRVRSWLVLALAFVLAGALLTAAYAQPPGGQGTYMRTRGGSFLGLLSVDKVRQELKLSEEQIDKVSEIGQKLREEMRQQYAGLREIEDWQKRRAKMTELRDQFDEKAHAEIREVLSREQMIRLYQIRLQVRGAVYGLNNEYIAKRLKLTPEQRKKAADIDKDTQEKMYDVYSELRNLSREERSKKMAEVGEKLRKIRDDANEQALALLTAEQKEAFEKLKGEKFEL